MNHLDIVLIIVLLVGFTAGYYKGLIKQLSFGAGIALGLLQAILFYPQVAQQIEEKTQWHSWICVVLAFVGIIMITVLRDCTFKSGYDGCGENCFKSITDFIQSKHIKTQSFLNS